MPEQNAQVTKALEAELCPWGCKPRFTTKQVSGPEPNFPDRKRPVIFCSHARLEGKKCLVIGGDDWKALIAAWNHRTRAEPGLVEVLKRCEAFVADCYDIGAGSREAEDVLSEIRAALSRADAEVK